MRPRVDGIPGIAPLHLQTLDPKTKSSPNPECSLPSKLLQIQIPLASTQSVPCCVEQDTLLDVFNSNLSESGSEKMCVVPYYSLVFRAMASGIRMRPAEEGLRVFLGQ